MYTVTTLTKDKNGLFTVTFNGNESLKIHEESIVKFRLLKGTELDEEAYQSLLKHIDYDKAYIKAINYISYKLRSEHEVNEYLSTNFESHIIDEVIDKLKLEGYINDEYFANALKNTMFRTTDKGPKALQQNLKKHHINENIIKSVVSEYDDMVDTERMEKLKNKLLRTYKGSQSAFKQKFLERCIQKGYDFKHIEHINLNNQVEEGEFLNKDLNKYLAKYSKKYNGYELKQKLIQALLRKGYDYGLVEEKIGELDSGIFTSNDEI